MNCSKCGGDKGHSILEYNVNYKPPFRYCNCHDVSLNGVPVVVDSNITDPFTRIGLDLSEWDEENPLMRAF